MCANCRSCGTQVFTGRGSYSNDLFSRYGRNFPSIALLYTFQPIIAEELAPRFSPPHVFARVSPSHRGPGPIIGSAIFVSQQDHTHSRGDDRERITRARQAAEALFEAKRPVSGPSVPGTAADQPRQPRVLRVTSPPAGIDGVKTSVSLEAALPPSISPAHCARIRTG